MGDIVDDILNTIEELKAKEKMPPLLIPAGTKVGRVEYYGFSVPNTRAGWDRWFEAAQSMHDNNVWDYLNAIIVRDVVIHNYVQYHYNSEYYFVPIENNEKWLGYLVQKELTQEVLP